jgi:hypothetical protein
MRITWDEDGTRLYRTGIDRGMIYGVGYSVPWNGLVKVSESPSGGDVSPIYIDGRKSSNRILGSNYESTVEAFEVPVEFAPNLGKISISPSLYVLDQPRERFDFSYRTLIGNDLHGSGLAYEIHLVYNVTARASDFTNSSNTTSSSPKTRTIALTTVPMSVPGFRPSSHFIFDSRKLDSSVLTAIEAILYGNDTDDARVLTLDELSTYLVP